MKRLTKKRLKNFTAVLLVAALGLSLAGCKGSSNSSSGSASGTSSGASSGTDEKPKVVRIAIPAADAASPIENAGIASALGYLDEELGKVGYEVEFTGFGQGGTAINEAFASKQIDVAFEGDIPPVIANDNGIELKVFASLNHAASMGIVVGNNSGINSVADLKGKKIVVGFGTTTYVAVLKLLENNGMSIDDVELINDIANGATLVASGDADAVVSSGMGIYQFEVAGIGKVLEDGTSFADSSLSNQYFAVSTKSFLEENPDAAKAIIRALLDAKDAVTADPEGTFEKISAEDRPAEIYAKVYPEEVGYEIFHPYLTDNLKEKFNELASILKDAEVIRNDVNADDVFINTYNEEVYQELNLDIPTE